MLTRGMGACDPVCVCVHDLWRHSQYNNDRTDFSCWHLIWGNIARIHFGNFVFWVSVHRQRWGQWRLCRHWWGGFKWKSESAEWQRASILPWLPLHEKWVAFCCGLQFYFCMVGQRTGLRDCSMNKEQSVHLLHLLSFIKVVSWSLGVAAGVSWRTKHLCGFGPSRTRSNLAGFTRKEEECPPCLGVTGRCAGSCSGTRSSCTLRMTARRSLKEPLISAQPSEDLLKQNFFFLYSAETEGVD